MQHKISGIVVKGDAFGRQLGFPTANVETKDTSLLPRAGVYAGSVELEGKEYRAGILLKPTGKLEAHLIGYNGDAYGKTMTLEFKKFLREYRNFESIEELKAQIEKDIAMC